jgi:hypothetical protein
MSPDMKKNPEFNQAALKGTTPFVQTEPLGFSEVPDWVRKDLQFQRGVQTGNISVIEQQPQAPVSAEVKKERVNGKKNPQSELPVT